MAAQRAEIAVLGGMNIEREFEFAAANALGQFGRYAPPPDLVNRRPVFLSPREQLNGARKP